jgi:phosphatidylglycerophosphate synthase
MVRIGPVGAVAAQVVLLAALAITDGLGAAGWAVGLVSAAVVDTTLAVSLNRTRAAGLGTPNGVTLIRATLASGVAAIIADSFERPPNTPALLALTIVALVLDGVDGSVARRTGTTSQLGARFDMEVDAFLILVLSVAVARSLGGWVLAIGLARYAFGLAGWCLPWLRRQSPPRYWAKVVAATQGVVLTCCVSTLLPTPVAEVGAALALGLLAESFGRQTWWLWVHRTGRTRAVPAPGPRPSPIRQSS